MATITQGDGDHLKAEFVSQLLSNGLVAFVVQFAGVNVGSFSLNAEYILGILFVGDAYVNILAQFGHGFASLGAGPQLATVVQVAGNLQAMSLSCLTCFAADLNNVGAQCGGDAGEVEPLGALEDLCPVEISGGSLLDCGVSTVIYELDTSACLRGI